MQSWQRPLMLHHLANFRGHTKNQLRQALEACKLVMPRCVIYSSTYKSDQGYSKKKVDAIHHVVVTPASVQTIDKVIMFMFSHHFQSLVQHWSPCRCRLQQRNRDSKPQSYRSSFHGRMLYSTTQAFVCCIKGCKSQSSISCSALQQRLS